MNYYWNIDPGGMLRYSESSEYNTTFQNMNEKDVNMPIKKIIGIPIE